MAASNDFVPLDPTYGAVYIGVLFATFFQGALSVQVYLYYQSFPNDSLKLKTLVALLWIIDFAHLVLIAQTAYHYLVTEWGNLDVLVYSTLAFDAHLFPLALSTIMCQAFFLWRFWVFSSRNVFLTLALSFLCSATFGLAIFIAVQDMRIRVISEFQELVPEVAALFSTGAASDVIIAVLLCYYLKRGSSGFENTDSIITHLMRYTVTTGLATSMLAVACLIAYFARPHTLIFIALHFSLGRMYTNSLLATLNSRKSFRRNTTEHTSVPPPIMASQNGEKSKDIRRMFSRRVPEASMSSSGLWPVQIEVSQVQTRSQEVAPSPSLYSSSLKKYQEREILTEEIELQSAVSADHAASGFAV